MKRLLDFLNAVVSLFVAVALALGGAYAGYALWDNRQIYSAAQGVQLEMLRLKPVSVQVQTDTGEIVEGLSFDELLAINPDVCAWVTMDNTNIDFPVLHGESNYVYINTNVYGEFALAGSIFMDSRCSRTCDEPYVLLYGHHMANHGMFGDLDLYKDRAFFEANQTGTLLLPGETHALHVIACVVTEASDKLIFEPQVWRANPNSLFTYCRKRALHFNKETLTALNERLIAGNARVLALSTCSDEYSNARTVVLTLVD